MQRREVAVAGSPVRPLVEELGTREDENEERARPRPLEQVLDEVEEARVGPLHVLEHENGRIRVREPLEEEPPGSEQVVALVRRLLLRDPEQAREKRLDEPSLVVVEQMLAERCFELRARGRVVVVLGYTGAHAHHVRQRPVRHALAVGEAAAAVPVDVVDEPVEVLVELPR